MVAKVREILINKVLPKYLRTAPDPELIAYWRVQLSEMRELRAADPRLCVAFLFPSADTNIPRQLSQNVSSATLKSDVDGLTALLNAAYLSPATVPSEAAVRGALQSAATHAERRSPGTLRVVAGRDPSAGNPKTVCDAELAYFEALVSLPPEQAGPALRYLASSS
jgi:hypothetical protein